MDCCAPERETNLIYLVDMPSSSPLVTMEKVMLSVKSDRHPRLGLLTVRPGLILASLQRHHVRLQTCVLISSIFPWGPPPQPYPSYPPTPAAAQGGLRNSSRSSMSPPNAIAPLKISPAPSSSCSAPAHSTQDFPCRGLPGLRVTVSQGCHGFLLSPTGSAIGIGISPSDILQR